MLWPLIFAVIFAISSSTTVGKENKNPLNTISLSSSPESTKLIHLLNYCDLEPKYQCEHLQAQYCFWEVYRNQTCLEKIKKEFNESEWDSDVDLEYSENFMNYFLPCTGNQIENYTRANEGIIPKFNVQMSAAISMLPSNFYDKTFQRRHQKCIIDQIGGSFIFTQCYMKFHFIVIEKTLEICRQEAMKKLSNNSLYFKPPAAEIVNAKSLAESIEETVPPNNVSLFEKKYLSQYISDKTARLPESLTDLHFWAIKEVINVNSHFRWFICSSLLAVQRPPTLTFHLAKKDEMVKNSTETKIDPYEKLEECRKLAYKNKSTYNGICLQ